MRPFFLLSLLVLLTACGSDAVADTAPHASPAPAPAPPPAPAVVSPEEQLAEIKAEYALISQEMEGEVYAADTVRYVCEAGVMEGEMLLYSDSEALRLVINSFSMGDHGGKIEYWYFKDSIPFFVLEETGTWQFGGPYREDEHGDQIVGSIDKIEQQRYYIAEGKVIKQLSKAFEIRSWEESPTADEVPNREVPTDGDLPEGYAVVKAAILTGAVNCDDLAM